MNLRDFEIREVGWKGDAKILSNIRRLVFIIEQSVPEKDEWDNRDEDCWHWLATDSEDSPVGTCRLLPDGQIGRMAVLSNWRGRGIGAALMEAAVEKARYLGFSKIYLHAQSHAEVFYERLGFIKDGQEFKEAGIAHYHMTRELRPPRGKNNLNIAENNHDASLANRKIYKLGIDKKQIRLQGATEFRNVILDMAAQARKSIRIYSPMLCHELFDDNSLSNIASTLGRLNKYTRVEILIFDTHRIIKHGHKLLTLSRRLPSSVGIKVVDPEIRQLNQEFVLVDKQGFIYRKDHEEFIGSASFMDIAENNRLRRRFSAAWENGIADLNLRSMRI